MSAPGEEARDVAACTVVVGVDRSAASRRAMTWAAERVRACGGSVVLLHAAESAGSLDDALAPQVHPRPGRVAALRPAGAGPLPAAAELLRHEAPDVDVRTRLVLGDPATALVAAGHDADLVVLGAARARRHRHSRRAVNRLVAEHAGVPVLVVGAEPLGTGPVVAAVEDVESGASVLPFAAREARLRGSRLVVVHVWQPDAHALRRKGLRACDPVDQELSVLLMLEAAAAPVRQGHPELPISLVPVEGWREDLLSRYGRAAQMLVVGAPRRRCVGRGAGSVVPQLLADARSLAVVPAG